jgi:hypothetical protein
VGGLNGEAHIDHQKIDPRDPNHLGLHPDTISSRAALYRWFRRGPFFNESNYMRRYIFRSRGRVPVYAEAEAGLHGKIIRLAQSGDVKGASEEYRRLTHVPPVTVVRALVAACVPGALLADAVAVYEDAKALSYVGRDAQVYQSLMAVAVRAKHAERVMWVHDEAVGTWSENVHVRAAMEPLQLYELTATALEFLLDRDGCEEAARQLYAYLAAQGLVDADVHLALGAAMQQTLLGAEGSIALPTAATAASCALNVDAERSLALVHAALVKAVPAAAVWAAQPSDLELACGDVSATFVARLARFSHGDDLLTRDAAAFGARAAKWLIALSPSLQRLCAPPVPYLLKSRAAHPDTDSSLLRIAVAPSAVRAARASTALYFDPAARYFKEHMPSMPKDPRGVDKFLVRTPVHAPVAPFVAAFDAAADSVEPTPLVKALPAAVLHPSVLAATQAHAAADSSATAASAGSSSTPTTTTATPSSEMRF